MIEAVTSALHRQQYLRAAQGCPGLAARLACQLLLFGEKPGSGWRFFTADRASCAALMTRGEAALGCGAFEEEELGLLLSFLGVKEYTCPPGASPRGYEKAEELFLYTLPQGSEKEKQGEKRSAPARQALFQFVLPQDIGFLPAPSFGQVTALVLEEQPKEEEALRQNFYSDLCTAQNHGMARVVGAEQEGRLVATVGAYGLWQNTAYLAAAETRPDQRGRGIGGALLKKLAAELQGEGYRPWFWCEERLCAHYERLGFLQKGTLSKFIRIE